MENKFIEVIGANEHNLKNISVKIPRNKLTVITGLSGSGKSTLAFDTIYAEGQRRYIESLSSYARQFLGQLEKPKVESITGLSPAISIEQKGVSKNPRSTVGTITEIYDYLRVLYARLGTIHCYKCNKIISSTTIDEMVNKIFKDIKVNSKFMILSPIIRGRKGEYNNLIEKITAKGFNRFIIDDNEFLSDQSTLKLNKKIKHTIKVVVDRIIMKSNLKNRLSESIETALKLSDGLVEISVINGENYLYSEKLSCTDCGISYPPLHPRNFSFNSPYGSCKTCMGLGTKYSFDIDLLIPDKNKSLSDNAISFSTSHTSILFSEFKSLAKHYKFDLNKPFNKLSKKIQNIILYGTGDIKLLKEYESEKLQFKMMGKYEGIIPMLERRYRQTNSENARKYYSKFMSIIKCPDCNGKKLDKKNLAVTLNIDNNKKYNIYELTNLSLDKLYYLLDKINLKGEKKKVLDVLIKEIKNRLKFLIDVGLSYLTLNRTARTLSGGESQRIRLATQVGSGLVGVLYVLDEPSIGLHQKDNLKLLNTLKKLRDTGNTVLVVEHDEETIRNADFIVDLGPGAGNNGGEIVSAGNLKNILKSKKSLTAQYLNKILKISIPEKRRKNLNKYIEIIGAQENNLKNINVKFPLNNFICITGVSGSGKSTLINEILYKAVKKYLYKSRISPGKHKKILGLNYIDKIINITQDPIGRTPRSNPATYIGVFTDIRDLFSKTFEAKLRGYKQGRFSFNVKGGRCEACQGDGVLKVEMHFLQDIYVKCDVCNGKRFNSETLEVKYKNYNIYDVLNMTVNKALKLFEKIPKIKKKLQVLCDVGLGYIKLGQPATTLSGGEAQRIKLVNELSKRTTGKTLYILDEPTTGLHFADVDKLLSILNKLVDMGNSIIVIEHNLDVIKNADYIVDLGPDGGDNGGEVIACGTPEQICSSEKSYTAKYLIDEKY